MGRLPSFLLLGYFTLARGRAQMKDQIRKPTTPINRSQVRIAHQLRPPPTPDGSGGVAICLTAPTPPFSRVRRCHAPIVDGKIALAHLLGYVHSRIVSVVYGVANKRFSFLNSDATLDTTGHHETITRHHETITRHD